VTLGIGLAQLSSALSGVMGLKSRPTIKVKIAAAPTPKPGVDLPPEHPPLSVCDEVGTFALVQVMTRVGHSR
jgi:hypothetical protein